MKLEEYKKILEEAERLYAKGIVLNASVNDGKIKLTIGTGARPIEKNIEIDVPVLF